MKIGRLRFSRQSVPIYFCRWPDGPMQFAFPDDIESVKAGKNVGTVWLDRLDFSVGHRIPPNCFMMLTDEMKMTAYRHPTLGEVLIVPKHHHHPFLHRLVRWFTQWVWMREVRAA